ncbi:MAG: FAD-dependent oxidoreductase [Saccharofermentans sp.]|nr:FAD-dependent oxidoreductase [Saccharofermentans sp.]
MVKELIFSPDKIGNAEDIKSYLASKSHIDEDRMTILKYFIDARRKPDIKICYRVTDEEQEDPSIPVLIHKGKRFTETLRPVIIGFGPAGMFAGLILAKYGLKPLIIEKGKDVASRTRDVEIYKKEGVIDPSSNIQFGEGGAGTFSDGKLNTGVSSEYKGFIDSVFIKHGAPEDIMYDSHPHVGTDNLVNVVKGIREQIICLGGEVHFEEEVLSIDLDQNGHKLKGITTNRKSYPADKLILAIGNSSRDFIKKHVDVLGVTSKPFSIGVRIEHLRHDIDMAMYGFDTALYKNIFAANYKLAVDTPNGNKLYTFCMCPGGEVVPSASFENAICTNGMSYRSRGGDNSNAALLVPFDPSKYSDDPLYGMKYQDMLEMNAYKLAGSSSNAPYMIYGDLKNGTYGRFASKIIPTYKPGVVACDFKELLPTDIVETFKDGIMLMGRKIKGFDTDYAVLTAPETRSSSPVRIPRDKDSYESVFVKGIYPAGEGAGYAGGIMSSAIDGIKCANRLAESVLL